MKLFVSYAGEDRDEAHRITLALRAAGHRVFWDRDHLLAGRGYHARIRKELHGSDAVVFLISPESIAGESYARAELEMAEKKWKDPSRRVVPVMLRHTPFDTIPQFLKAVTILQPEGDRAAGVEAAVSELGSERPQGGVRELPARYISELLSLLSGPKAFLRSVNVDSRAGMTDAMWFLLISAFLATAMQTPRLGPGASAGTLYSSVIIQELVGVILGAGMLRAAWWLVGGRAPFRAFLSVYSYTSGVVVLGLSLISVAGAGVLRISDTGTGGAFVAELVLIIGQLGLIGWGLLAWGAYRELNDLSRADSLCVSAVMAVLVLFILGPVLVLLSVGMSPPP